jgi:hypothetical protein
MSVDSIYRKTSIATQQENYMLPKDLEIIVGKTHLIFIDIMANLQAFFRILIFGSFRNFVENIKMATTEIANQNKLNLYYKKIKKPIFYRKVFQLYPTKISDDEYKKVEDLLKRIEVKNSPNHNALIIELQNLLNDTNISKELKNFIEEKLIQISNQTNLQNIEPKTTWDKIKPGIVTLVSILAISIISYGAYSLFTKYSSTPSLKDVPTNDKICVFTSYSYSSSNQTNLAKSVVENQRAYCNKHGYSYEAYNKNFADVLPYWSKIKGILEHLDKRTPNNEIKCDSVVWVDDDAVFTNSDYSLESIMKHFSDKNTQIMVTEDGLPNTLNTGIIFTKNTPIAKKILTDVWNMRNQTISGKNYTYGNCPNQKCFHEQDALADYIQEKGNNYIKIIPQRQIIPFNDKFSYNINMNTFLRENHFDWNRNKTLNYDKDDENIRWNPSDFLGHCTGLSTNASRIHRIDDSLESPINLKKMCIEKLLNTSKISY